MRACIYFPSRERSGREMKNRIHAIERARMDVCTVTGGCTTYPGTGSWVDASGKLINENVDVIETYCDDACRDALLEIARGILYACNQDCVLVTFDSVPVFVNRTPEPTEIPA